jgi:tetratricopeptide (TPR) repeat protein
MNSRRAGLVLLIVALGVLLLSLTPYPHASTRAKRQAEAHRAAGGYSTALAAYDQAAHLAPYDPQAWQRMGEVYLLQGRFLEASTAFHEARLRGGGLEAMLGLGESYAGRGDWAAAIRTWLDAQSLAPDEPGVYLALGQGALAQGRFDGAEGYLKRALELEPAPDVAARAHSLLGQLLIASDPKDAALHFKQAGDEEMLALLDAADAENNPTRRQILLGAAFLQRSALTLARRSFELATAKGSDSGGQRERAAARAYLGHSLDLMGETVAAREMLEEALDLEPESALALFFLGQHHMQVGNTAMAQDAFWQALHLDPENAALQVAMGETFVEEGDYASAQEWYEAAVDTAPDDLGFRLVLTRFFLDHLYQVEESGLPSAREAVDLAPENALTYDMLGWAHFLSGNAADSQEALLEALALEPRLISAHYHLGQVYASTGQRTLARQHLQRAIDLDTEGYYRRQAEGLLGQLE